MSEKQVSVVDLIEVETKRLSDKFGKSFFDCADIMKITGLGRDNIRTLMNSNAFPVKKVGNRKVVSIINFASWQMENN